MYEINQHIIPNRKICLKMKIYNLVKLTNGREILRKYKISNFWKGNFFIKRLINKIFKYQLNIPLKWDQKFWDIISVKKGLSEIEITDGLESLIKEKTLSKRFKDIIVHGSIKMVPPLVRTIKTT